MGVYFALIATGPASSRQQARREVNVEEGDNTTRMLKPVGLLYLLGLLSNW